jgi:hypothetical protein
MSASSAACRCVKSPTPRRSRSARSRRSNATTFHGYQVDPEQTVREFLSQFPHDSVTAGSPHVVIDDGSGGARQLDRRVMMIVGTLVLVVAAILFWSLK